MPEGWSDRSPSSGPSDHLLPQGEKDEGHAERAANAGSPSPLVGEGARRAGEGGGPPAPRHEETHQPVSPRLRGIARKLRRNSTEAEKLLWELLRNRRFAAFKFRRQVPVGPFVADFACFDAMLIIELDGSQHFESQRDAARDSELGRRGFHILRIWNNDLAAPDSVLDAIWHALHRSTLQ